MYEKQEKNTKPENGKISAELSSLIDDVVVFATEEVQCKVITPLFFIACAMGRDDCMLYNVVMSTISKEKCESMVGDVNEAISPSIYTAVRPNTKPKIGKELNALIGLSEEERKKTGSDFATSNHVLLALLSNKGIDEQAYSIVSKYIKYDEFLEGSKNMTYVTKAVSKAETDDDAYSLLYSPEKMHRYVSGFENSSKKYSGVQYCKNLNGLACLGKINKLVGRENIISLIDKALAKKDCNNAFLVGNSGVGKTAIVEGLSRMIVEGTAPLSLLGKVIYSLKTSEVMSGSSLHGVVEERMLKIMNSIKGNGDSILFIDDAHVLAEVQKNSDIGVLTTLSDAMQSNGISVIMASTTDGYSKVMNQMKDFKRKFQRIDVDPMSIEESIQVIDGVKDSYEKFHDVIYNDEVIKDAVNKSKRFITDIALPSSAIGIIDAAGSLRKLEFMKSPELSSMVSELGGLCMKRNRKRTGPPDEKEEAETNNRIGELRDSIGKYVSERKISNEERMVSFDDINKAISDKTGVPVEKIGTSERKALAGISEKLKKVVVGQDEAIDSICGAIKRNKIGLYRKNRPIYTAFLLGPTGVGKTLTAKMLAKEIFGDEKYLVKFDMSEYSDKTSVNKLIGAGAGYIGYDDGGLLTEAVKNKKYAVVLFDEIEKADDLIYNLLLQVLDEATLTDNMGNKVDFRNTIVLLTSNVGARKAQESRAIGFTSDTGVVKREVMERELKRTFPPEFINRVDDVIYYNDLTEKDIDRIIRDNLDSLQDRVNGMGYTMEYNDSLVDFIYNKWTDEHEYGARPILRIIEKYVEGGITDSIIENDYETHDFKITADQDKVLIS